MCFCFRKILSQRPARKDLFAVVNDCADCSNTTIGGRLRRAITRGESGISFTGLYVFGVISLFLLVLKLSVIDTWSWWRVILPFGLIVVFNVTNMVVAFIYLAFAHIPERPHRDEAEILEPHTINVHFVAAMLLFIVFSDNLVRWIDGSETSH
jgi:hypothetical protein